MNSLVVDGQRAQVGEGAPAELAGEGNSGASMLALMLGQVPRVLEGSLAQRAVERSLPGVGELVSPDVRGTGERLPARFTRQGLSPAWGVRRPEFPRIVWLSHFVPFSFCFALFWVSHREKLDRRENFVGAGRRRCEFLPRPCQILVLLGVKGLHVEVRRAAFVHGMKGTLRAGEDNGRHRVGIPCRGKRRRMSKTGEFIQVLNCFSPSTLYHCCFL